MNPQQQQIDALSIRIAYLEQYIQSLGNSSSIPSEIDDAFSERFGTANLVQIGGTSSETYSSYSSFAVSVPQVTGLIALIAPNGTTYNVLYK